MTTTATLAYSHFHVIDSWEACAGTYATRGEAARAAAMMRRAEDIGAYASAHCHAHTCPYGQARREA